MKTRMNFKDEFYQKLKLLVLPIAIQNFMLALVSATDAIMLGWIDQTSLSAVSLAGQVQFVLSLFISGIAAGAGIMAAQYWGKRDAASIEKVIPIALRTNLLFSGLFTILAGFCPEMLMRIFTNDAALVASGSQYLRAVALSYVLCGISQVYLILLKNTGHAAVSSRISSTAVVLNIILNAILIYGLCGAPALGIRGAAYATVAARVVELIWAYLETKKPERVRILWNRLFSSAGKILSEDFWRYTLPVLAASLVWGIAYVLYSVNMGHMGSDAVAAKPEFTAYGKDIAMQIAAANPGYLCEAEVPADTIAKEKEILLAQIENEEKESGKSKPEQVKAKMVEGKIAKFFKENCLINQIFVKDQEITVAKFTENTAKELGGDIKITKFVRFEKGEGIEKREDDFAAEIASLVK